MKNYYITFIAVDKFTDCVIVEAGSINKAKQTFINQYFYDSITSIKEIK